MIAPKQVKMTDYHIVAPLLFSFYNLFKNVTSRIKYHVKNLISWVSS